jgi:tRNA(Glu) U13 pseudouridine synthase TruD
LAPFPNFYGRQRFGGRLLGPEQVVELLANPVRKRDEISVLQAAMFNIFLRRRLLQSNGEPAADEWWTKNNGKRFFQAPLDDELRQRFQRGEVAPTGPIFGYKVPLRDEERGFLESWEMEPSRFRAWGKRGRGARRPLYQWARFAFCHADRDGWRLGFSLESGSYATVYLIHLFMPELLAEDESRWPDFTERISLL